MSSDSHGILVLQLDEGGREGVLWELRVEFER